MRHSIVLRTEPSVGQTEKVIARLERELVARGVTTTREGPGRLRFRVPLPWKAPKPSALLAISKGAVRVSAGAGERRQVRYELDFARLAGLAVALSVILLAIGLGWPRRSLIASLGIVWALLFGAPWAYAASRFHRLMAHAARDVIERRSGERLAESTPASVPAVGEAPPPGATREQMHPRRSGEGTSGGPAGGTTGEGPATG